uniref:Haloacid dehalogenase-like hydrolase domain-containing protein 2 n=2 Tax=Myotis lucifugus TaxID=59463 RepID=G1P1M4_MYOLU
MAFTLYSLLQAALLCVNAIAVLHEERFLKNIGWGTDQGIGGFGEEPGIKSQLMNLIRSVRTVMRASLTSQESKHLQSKRECPDAIFIQFFLCYRTSTGSQFVVGNGNLFPIDSMAQRMKLTVSSLAIYVISGYNSGGDITTPGLLASATNLGDLIGLRGTSVMVKFVTNTTKESKRDLLERLKKLEFDISEDEIFTSLTAARNLVEQKQVRPMLLVDDRALPDFKGIQTSDPNAVVIGLAPEHFHYQTLNQAFRLLLDGAPLIAIHKARYYKRKDGLALGPGPFVTALEYATDTKATVVGKPEKTFFLEALRGTGCEPEEAVMIGDDCRDDVGGAQDVGMLGILVKTGKYRAADEEKISPPPYLTCESFPHAVDHILQHLL